MPRLHKKSRDETGRHSTVGLKEAGASPAAAVFSQLEELRAALIPVVNRYGCVLESLRVRGSGSYSTLEVVIDDGPDSTESLTVDTLADISYALSGLLDEVDDGESPYTLEVLSVGAERELRTPEHWKRSRGRLVRVILVGEQEGFLARLDEVGDEGPRVRRQKQTKKGQRESYREQETLLWGSISQAKVEIEFNS